MAGFFKTLFNRIAGKPAAIETAVPEAQVELPPLPPELEIMEPEILAPEPVVAYKPAVKKPPAKKTGIKSTKIEITRKIKPVTKSTLKPVALPLVKAAPKVRIKSSPVKKTEVKRPASKKPAVDQKPILKTKSALPPAENERIFPSEQTPAPEPIVQRVDIEPIVTTLPLSPGTGWLTRLTQGLSKSSKTITGSITAIFTKRKLDRQTLQELEDTLIQADLGIAVSERIIAAVSFGRYDKEIDPEEVKQILASEVAKVLKPVEVPFNFGSEKPFVILVVGVNGSGKTTTIGKLGSIAAAEGFKVMFAACDTFRAAAVEQLTVWGNRIGASTKSAALGADSAGLAFDALKHARQDGTDILFIDTAGRLQNKAYLMDELDKVVRVIKKMDPAAPHAVLLVLDATTGQNALAQADVFTKVAGVTGLIMTKLDGTARGGILVAIAEKFKLPIHAIGVGEAIDDLQPFDALAFSRAIAGFQDQ